MRNIKIGALVVGLMLIGPAAFSAQHQMGGEMQMGGQSAQQEHHGGQQQMGAGMMGMMCPMMGGGMGMMGMPPMRRGMGQSGMGMMGMMGGGQMDPKAMGKMLQLRGEILKAVGEVMLKHGKALEEAK